MNNKILEWLKILFSDDTRVITTEDGQRAITLETLEPEVEGLKLFDVEELNENQEIDKDIRTEEEPAELLSVLEKIEILARKLEKIESLIDTPLNINVDDEEVEEW